MKKSFWPILSPIIERDKLKGQFIRVLEVLWQIVWKVQDHFCNTQEVVENANFWKKKGKISSK